MHGAPYKIDARPLGVRLCSGTAASLLTRRDAAWRLDAQKLDEHTENGAKTKERRSAKR